MNKKILTVMAAGLAISTLLVSCKDKGADTTTPPVNNQQTVTEAHFTYVEHGQDKPSTLESTDESILYISASAEKAAFVADDRNDRPSAKKINDVLTQAYERSKGLYNSMIDELDAYISGETPADMSVFPWESRADFTCLRNDGKAISVSETIESKAAGALIRTTVYTYNFNPANGDQIQQVFYTSGDKDSFDKADDKMYTKLAEIYGDEIINYNNVSSSFVEAAEQCWYFTENGVHVAFNPGTIAPEEAGVLEIDYTKEELPEAAQKYFN